MNFEQNGYCCEQKMLLCSTKILQSLYFLISTLVGRVNAKGQISGMRIAYIYPDFRTAYIGQFEDGILESAKATILKTVVDQNGIKIPIFDEPDGPSFNREVSNFDFVTNSPQLADPYESRIVKVSKSQVEGANEGLFARCKIEPNTILAFYNGIRLNPKKARDEPNWEDNVIISKLIYIFM